MAEVLIIDDEAAVANLMKASLQATYNIAICSGGEQAMAQLRAGSRFKAIVCDVHLQDLDGPDLFKLIQDLDPIQAKRILFVTGGINDQRLFERVNLTRCLVLYKPYHLTELIQAVESVVSVN